MTLRSSTVPCSSGLVATAFSTVALLLTLTPPVAGGVPASLELDPLVSGLNRPITVRTPGDGSDRLFIVEQSGRIQLFRPDAGLSLFLDITALVDDGGNEQGLLGLDFHPDFESNGLFYVNYTRDPGPGLDRTVVARYQVSAADPDVADPASAFVLLEVEQDFSNHNGGNILFGPDGYLYVGMGDGGSGGDPNNRAQPLSQLLGKMLRIDVDGAPAGGDELCGLVTNYGIPGDNPFVGSTGSCDEIWASGLRNPWRFSFDRDTGDLLIGDVGQLAREEIDFQPASSSGGENYGWRCREGDLPFNNNPPCNGPLEEPILVYSHAGGNCSVTGGYRYRGAIPDLQGTYVYADFCTGQIFFGEQDGGGNWSSTLWMDASQSIASFGEDRHGEIYLTDFNTGTVFRFESPIFADSFESGDTSAWTVGP